MRVGIAGYMGAGKSVCAARLSESEDALVIDADAQAKTVMLRDSRLQEELRSVFGTDVVSDNGNVRFDVLGRLAFKSMESLQALNRITRVPVMKHLKTLMLECEKSLCVLDAALIPIWGGVESWFDLLIWVDTPFETRFERLKAKRTDISEEELIRRMRLQEEMMSVPDAEKWVVLRDSDCCDYIVDAVNKTSKAPLSIPDSAKRSLDGIVAILKQLVESDISGPLDKSFHDDLDKALALFDEYQRETLSANGVKAVCGAGCGVCCFHWVEDVRSFEIAIIGDYLRNHVPERIDEIIKICRVDALVMKGLEAIVDDKIAESKATDIDKTNLLLSSFYQLERPCPLLTPQGECGVYDVRPLTCRIYMNLSDASRCLPININKGETATYVLDLPEEASDLIEKLDTKFRDAGEWMSSALRAGIVEELAAGFK